MKIKSEKTFRQVICLSAVLIFGLGFSSCTQPEPIKIIPPPPTATLLPTATPAPIQVYISGKVMAPDVYTLEPGSRIKQLVEAAGGFAEGANSDVVNLAQPLADGAHVHIPAIGDEPAVSLPVLSDPGPQRSSGEIPIGSSTGLININLAQREELESLPGIGPVIAQNILDFRDANGSFRQIESIMDVPGIGEGKFEQIRALITVGN
jgi:competence protein ComEA